jgi:hypothetical protein
MSRGVSAHQVIIDEAQQLTHTEDTLRKVYEGMMDVGITETQAVNAVFNMQNRGILFRERADGASTQPDSAGTTAGDSRTQERGR